VLARLAGKVLGHLYLLQRFLLREGAGQKLMNARRGRGQLR
jgi:hypothetical protein